jgi:STE24 endopeptidase
MSFLLMVFLTFVCLPEVRDYVPIGFSSLPASVALTWLAMALIVLFAYRLARRTSRALDHDPDQRDVWLRRYERLRYYHRLALFAAYLVALFVCGWGWSVDQLWRVHGWLLPAPELLLLAPFLIAQALSWAFFYDVDRASTRAAQRLLEDDPFVRAWNEGSDGDASPSTTHLASRASGRLGYVAFQARQKLALVFVPVFFLIVQKELYRRLTETQRQQWQWVLTLGGFVAIFIVFLCMPWLMRLVLGLRSLPPGPLRDRLLAASRRLRFRCSDVLLWNTHNGMANAMVIGVVPWIRYVVFTDRLLEDFTEDEVEAVFGHEVGHVRHQHMLYYAGFLCASLCTLWLVADHLRQLLEDSLKSIAPSLAHALSPDGWLDLNQHEFLAAVPLMILLLSYILVVFGFLSRRCERQADVFGCRAVSCPQGECPGHEPGQPLAPCGRGLCKTGIRTFIRALEKVALINGISRDRPGFLQSWQHSTIARRVDFLQRVLEDPAVEPRFQRRVLMVKSVVYLVLGCALFLLIRLHLQSGMR